MDTKKRHAKKTTEGVKEFRVFDLRLGFLVKNCIGFRSPLSKKKKNTVISNSNRPLKTETPSMPGRALRPLMVVRGPK